MQPTWREEYAEYTTKTVNLINPAQISLTIYFMICFVFIIFVAATSTLMRCMEVRREVEDLRGIYKLEFIAADENGDVDYVQLNKKQKEQFPRRSSVIAI